MNLSDLDGKNGVILNGAAIDNRVGSSVSGAGDINNDKVDDVVIGAPGASRSYVAFGFFWQ